MIETIKENRKRLGVILWMRISIGLIRQCEWSGMEKRYDR